MMVNCLASVTEPPVSRQRSIDVLLEDELEAHQQSQARPERPHLPSLKACEHWLCQSRRLFRQFERTHSSASSSLPQAPPHHHTKRGTATVQYGSYQASFPYEITTTESICSRCDPTLNPEYSVAST